MYVCKKRRNGHDWNLCGSDHPGLDPEPIPSRYSLFVWETPQASYGTIVTEEESIAAELGLRYIISRGKRKRAISLQKQ